MWSTRNKEPRTRNKKSNYLGLGIFLIIIGGILTIITIGYFFIVIGVILLLAGISSKSGGIGKSPYTTDSIMKEKEYCPKCGARRYSRFSTKCVTCSYIFISDFRKAPTISNKEAEEPKKTSEVQSFPPISDLLQGKETSKPISSVSELKTEEKQTSPSTSEKKIEKSFTTCPHCRQKLPLGAKFCAKCGQKVEVLKPIPPMLGKNETNAQRILDWVKYQYYDLGRSIQDIADDLGESMIGIRKLLYRSGIISEKKEVESITDVPPLKTEEIQLIPPISDLIEDKETSKPILSVSDSKTDEIQTAPSTVEKKVEKSFITCPNCRQKLPLGAKFCDICGQKVEVLKEIPLISDIEEETLKISTAEEILPTTPVIEIKKEKSKKKLRVCKFCGMIIPKNNSFCLQCGMIIKIR